ncbi:GNAT family N-acetyltransferase [Cyclobacterium sp.]|uniref:GNAT family N-acetyltransferase n=1 Tax=Cyclobacterium sp. TaxID=1966343 RepID=UPI0019A1AB8D|nr:GNAT family N-acetyltransferase [Cyclobacterium sp.]MBD3631251.1 GNAT family N-acetyltransferase [Cyclobacterium sp.]
MIKIYQADSQQIPLIQDMAKIIWPIAFGEILSSEQLAYMMDMMYSKGSLQEQMGKKAHKFLIASKGKESLGFASYELHYLGLPQLKIHKLYILPTAQGSGIGKKILTYLETEGEKTGMKNLVLNVNKYNSKAIQFYEKRGFTKIRDEVIPIGNGYVMDDFTLNKKI